MICQIVGVFLEDSKILEPILAHELDGIEVSDIDEIRLSDTSVPRIFETPCTKAFSCYGNAFSRHLSSIKTEKTLDDPNNELSDDIIKTNNHNSQQILAKKAVPEIKSTLQTKENLVPNSSGKLILKVFGEVFDLKNKEDLKRWRERSVFNQKNGIYSLSSDSMDKKNVSTLRSISSASTSSITIVTSAKANIEDFKDKFENIKKNLLKVTKKARTDINIHNPLKPIPTALEYPMIDKRGKRLKRVFIPGRGWVASKVLQMEKQDLYSLIGNEKIL